MNSRDIIIFVSSEFFCFGLLTFFHEWFLSSNLRGMEQYFENSESAAQFGIIMPFLIGLALILYIKYRHDKFKKYLTLGIIIILFLIAILFLSIFMRNASNFIEGYLFYLFPLALLWFFVYLIHGQLDKRLPK